LGEKKTPGDRGRETNGETTLPNSRGSYKQAGLFQNEDGIARGILARGSRFWEKSNATSGEPFTSEENTTEGVFNRNSGFKTSASRG